MDWEARLDEWRDELALFDRLEGWVPLSEAESSTGVSRSALRSWYRSGQIESRLVDGPHGPQRLVRLDEVSRRASRSPRIRKSSEDELARQAQVEILQAKVDRLESRLSLLERLVVGTEPPPGG